MFIANWMLLGCSKNIHSSSVLSRHSLSLMTHEDPNILFTTDNHRSLCRARRMQSTISTQKMVLGKCICKVGRQEITENFYACQSAYSACAPVRLSIIKVWKYFRCSFQHYKANTRWSYCGCNSNKNWISSSSGKVTELLLNRTIYIHIYIYKANH
jgi:hypothetical protein